jgi:uncharacterized membrane protein YoaT (DUF817 family)
MQRPVRNPTFSSGARHWAPLARFIKAEARIGAWAEQRRSTHALYEFVRFGIKQGWACLFGALVLALLIGTHLFYPRGTALTRYDFLVIAAVAIQIAMLAFKFETWEEAKVIFIFHVVGTAMEIFKTSVGSWIYPEDSMLRVGGVPLFTGFMYAAIGSYIARCWRLFDFRFTHHPPLWALVLLAAGIYVNFFAHHYVWDARVLLFALTALLFGRCWVHFKVWQVHRRMPLLVGFALVALFIWFAENIGTFTAAWMYPHQRHGWTLVTLGKLGAWFLLMIISYVLVALVNRPRAMPAADPRRADQVLGLRLGFQSSFNGSCRRLSPDCRAAWSGARRRAPGRQTVTPERPMSHAACSTRQRRRRRQR